MTRTSAAAVMPAERPLWLTKADASTLCGLSTRQFSDAIQPRLGPDGIQGRGAALRFHGPDVVAALVAYRIEQDKPVVSDPTDPMMSGPTTDELERYRRLKADMVERDIAERDGLLVKRHVIIASLAPALGTMRGTGDRLARQFGNEAADIFNEGVAEFEAAALKLVEPDAGG